MRAVRLCGAWTLLLCPLCALGDVRPDPLEATPRPDDPSLETAAFPATDGEAEASDPGGTRVCGVVVYDNTAGNVSNQFYAVPAGGRAADECYLIGSERTVCEIVSTVRNNNTTGSPATIELELWSACPGAGGVLLASSGNLSAPINSNTTFTWTLTTPVTLTTYPPWVAWRNVSGTANVGPLVTRTAETGFTGDLFYTTNCGGTPACTCWFSSNPYAGFSARIEATNPVPCTVTCPPGGVAEGEIGPCDPNSVDNYNGGCNSTPNVFLDIPCGATICGTVSNYAVGATGSARDTDWYRVTISTPSVLVWRITGQTPMQAFIFQPGAGGSCTGRTTLASGVADSCQEITLTTNCLQPGQYWLWAGSTLFRTVPCNTPYVARLDCYPCTCGLQCQPGANPEAEPVCTTNYVDNFNGGCNSTPTIFQPLAPGEVICGESGNYLSGTSSLRDTDWYAVALTQQANLTASLVADFPVAVFIIQPGTPVPCTDFDVLIADIGPGCLPLTRTASCLAPGFYWIVVAPVAFSGVNCGSKYVLQATATPCNPPPTVGLFSAGLDSGNILTPGDLNTAWSDPEFGGPWFQYPNGWWNEWWPNEYDPTRPKRIRVFVDLYTWNDGFIEIAVNWSGLNWSPGMPRPPLPYEDWAVQRYSFGTYSVDGSYYFEFTIPYCPPWVSIDIRGARAAVQGRIEHECLAPTVIPPGTDCWATDCGATQTSFANNPIPAGFFDPGSEPFDGTVRLQGGSGPVDTIVQRLAPMSFPGPLPSSTTIPIEIVSLNLVSCQPITVQTGGTGIPWNVSVDLSSIPAPPGSMTVTKTHANGGTFTSQLWVQPRFTFTRVNPPNDTRVLDTGVLGMPPILLQSPTPSPWFTDDSFATTPCQPDGFAPGYDGTCCNEVCHSSFGTAPHVHCTRPPHCPACPVATGACCIGLNCVPNLTQFGCLLDGGVWMGAGTDCFPNPCVPPLDYWLDLQANVPVEQGGTGYSGTWYQYPNFWWNQWWPNEYDPTRQKRVRIRFWIEFNGPPPLVAFNYAAQGWGNPNQPPLPQDDAQVIRVPISPPVSQSGYYDREIILPFCPAWVSVDVRAATPSQNLRIQGYIEHICLPPGPTGACCHSGGTCQVTTQAGCSNNGGVWMGAGTDCFPNPCVPPLDYWLDLQANVPVEQGGTGYNGTWYQYPNFWWNQWWPNEYSLLRQKQISLQFWIDFAGPPPTVAFNYSVPSWANPNQPPPPPQDAAVVRVPVDPPVEQIGWHVRELTLPFCPAWVSVDVRAATLSQNLQIQGYIEHICLPPALCLGDADCDGDVDFFDIDPWVAKLGCPSSNPACTQGCPWQQCDMDQDGIVSFFDIDAFVAALGQACP